MHRESCAGGIHCLTRYCPRREQLAEPAPSRIQLLTGPRQVGKTTLLLELAAELGDRAIYAPADNPEASLPGWWERLWVRLNEVAAGPAGAVLLLDEAHRFPDWATRLKAEVDRLKQRGTPIHIIATGSSALGITWRSRESLAGRFERLTMTHWSASDLMARFGIDAGEAVRTVVAMGTYPGAMDLRYDLPRWQAYMRDAIVEPAIARDIMELTEVRKPGLLRQIFALCMTFPARIVALNTLQGGLQDRGALETISHYLHLLEEAFLVAPLPKFSVRLHRRRAAPPKIVVLNNALMAAADPLGSPDPVTDSVRFGAWIENACLAYCWNSGHQVAYWREEPLELDGVIEGPWGRWAIEIMTGTLRSEGLRGLLEFTRRHPTYRPLLLCDRDQTGFAGHLGIPALPWDRFLLEGPGGVSSS